MGGAVRGWDSPHGAVVVEEARQRAMEEVMVLARQPPAGTARYLSWHRPDAVVHRYVTLVHANGP